MRIFDVGTFGAVLLIIGSVLIGPINSTTEDGSFYGTPETVEETCERALREMGVVVSYAGEGAPEPGGGVWTFPNGLKLQTGEAFTRIGWEWIKGEPICLPAPSGMVRP